MPTIEEQVHSFADVDKVIANEEKFKAKLGAGASAFASLKVADVLKTTGGVGTAFGAGAGAAHWVFAPSAIAILFGASTPVVLVIGAGAAVSGLSFGVNQLYRVYYGSRVDEVPRFLNSAIDALGVSFLDLVGSLAIKVAAIDGYIHEQERQTISEYFIDEWGFDPTYTDRALDLMEAATEDQRISDMASTLADYARTNPDYDFTKVQKGLNQLLTEIAEADGKLDEREEMAIERILAALEQEVSAYRTIKRTAKVPLRGISTAAGWVKGKLSRGSE